MKKGPQLFRITMSALKAPGPGAAGDSASGVDAPVAGTTPEGAVPPHKKVTCEAQPTGAAGWWAALVSLWQEPDRSLLTASPSLVQDQGAPRSWLWPAMPPGEVLERSPWGPALAVQWRTSRGGASSPPSAGRWDHRRSCYSYRDRRLLLLGPHTLRPSAECHLPATFATSLLAAGRLWGGRPVFLLCVLRRQPCTH